MRFLIILLLGWTCLFGTSLKYFGGGDFVAGFENLSLQTKNAPQESFSSRSYSLGINGGVEQFWDSDNYIGGRILGEFTMGLATPNVNGTKIAGLFSFMGAMDLMLDFLPLGDSDLGIFGGFEYGLLMLTSSESYKDYKLSSETHSAFWRIGVSLLIQKEQRIEFLYKAPLNPLSLPENVNGIKQHKVFSGGQLSVGFKALFW
ncbi:hypothetical protein BBW65_06755 [Helicobacter enhydrae]|uniref:Outer membrane beta-barrel protein n=1 Tax=Helicobacter enhydrae TaxID=222136 RepID=A0A1B1U6Z5_9HELI|nr:outer membrane beta-barrel protein [Helicobacter enhydrae]ANV98510.1 hypothetical protein BBW65_06755 [Helicobacter enhydrae]